MRHLDWVKDAKMDQTVLEAILASLQAAGAYNQNDQVAPAAILWTDKDQQWEPLVPRLHQLLQLTLGAYDPASRTGPAIWLKCMLARALSEADWPADDVPILYLPDVGRQELRAVEECPKSLQPLAEHSTARCTGRNSMPGLDPPGVPAIERWRVRAGRSARASDATAMRRLLVSRGCGEALPGTGQRASRQDVRCTPLVLRPLNTRAESGCVIYADGLRFDIGQKLKTAIWREAGRSTGVGDGRRHRR